MTKKTSSKATKTKSTRTPKKLGTKPKPAAPTPPGRVRAEKLTRRVAELKPRIADDFYELGELLHDLERERLYEVLGHASLGDLVETRGLMSKVVASRLLAVVEAVPKELALRLGSDKAHALVTYVRAVPTAESAAAVAAAGVMVEGRRKSLEELTARDLLLLAQGERRDLPPQSRGPRQDDRDVAEAKAKEAAVKLRKRVAKGKLSVVQQADGWWLRIEVPLDQAERLFSRG